MLKVVFFLSARWTRYLEVVHHVGAGIEAGHYVTSLRRRQFSSSVLFPSSSLPPADLERNGCVQMIATFARPGGGPNSKQHCGMPCFYRSKSRPCWS